MKIKIRNFWYRLQASFWFLSALLAAAAILLSFTITAIDVGAERTLVRTRC